MRVEITFSKREGGFLSFKFCKITIMHKCVVLIQERINGRTVQEGSVEEMLAYMLKFIYSEKATKFCEIFTLLLSYVAPVKSKMKIAKILWPSQNIWTLPPFPSSNGPAALVLVLPIHIMYLHFCSKKFCLSTWCWLSFVSSLNFFLIWLCLLTWKIKK